MRSTPVLHCLAVMALGCAPITLNASDKGTALAALNQLQAESEMALRQAIYSNIKGDHKSEVNLIGIAHSKAQYTLQQSIDAGNAGALGKNAKSLNQIFIALVKTVSATKALVNDQKQTPLNRYKSLHKGNQAALKANTMLFKTGDSFLKTDSAGDFFILEELKSAKGGFQQPGAQATFRVHGLIGSSGNVCSDASVGVTNSSGANDVVEALDQQSLQTKGEFRLTLGTAEGSSKILITTCGKTTERLLYNYGGASPKDGGGSRPAGVKFDGIYKGTFSGTAKVGGSSEPVSGDVLLTVVNGNITVTDPGAGSGTISFNGSTAFTGRGSSDGVSYSFTGTFDVDGTGIGGWKASFAGGSASGVWNVAK